VLLTLIAALLLAIAFSRLNPPQRLGHQPQPHDSQAAHSYVSVNNINEKHGPASLNINVGVRVRTIHDINLPEQSFDSEGWYWLQWGKEVQDLIEEFNIAPDSIIEIVNAVERNSTVYEPSVVIGKKKDDKQTYYLSVFFSGKFFVPNVDLKNSPFDPLILPIILEVAPAKLSMGTSLVSLNPEMNTNEDPIAGEFASVSGFKLSKTSWQNAIVTYLSPPDAPSGSERTFSRATALFTYSPGFWAVFVQWIMPLLVVMGIVVLTPSLDGNLGDSRLAIPTAALLTLIFLHLGYKTSFPEAPYLTYLDFLYAYSYGVCISIYVLFVLSSNAHCRGNRHGEVGKRRMRQDRIESIVQVSVLVGYGCVAVLGWHA
jgi:hypothetical protein